MIRASFACDGKSYLEVPEDTVCSAVSLPLCGRASSTVTSLTVNGAETPSSKRHFF